jgi:hypothetical protein
MKRSRVRTVLSYGTVLLLIGLCYGWLKFGVFSDREFGSLYLFSKYRLSPHFFFSAPTGESDTPDSSLSPYLQREEAAFHEFVEVHDGYHHKIIRLSQ